jgi:gamma-glutamyltranspeptidase/glutathione hydrolase
MPRSRRAWLAVPLTLALATAGVAAGLPASAQPAAAPPVQHVATGTGGAVVSDSPDATQAGLSVLRHGGNAADAAVAVASTLGVTDPYVAGIGGGGYFVYYDARTHHVSTIDGRETTPLRATSDLFIDPSTGKSMTFPDAVTSGLSVGVPGTLMTWQQALRRWGTRSLGELLRPAEQVADRGFTVTPTLREQTRENAGRFAQFTPTSKLFLPGGKLPEVGSTFRNPALAATYREIAQHGVGALYGGSLGRDVVSTVQHLPLAPGGTIHPRAGLMRLPDLARYQAPYQAPTHVDYRGLDVYGMGPSSSGGSTTGEALNILGTFNLRGMSRVEALHHYLEASRLAFADRNRYVGDSAYVKVPLKQLLSTQFARQRACLIDPDHALTSPVAPGDPSATGGGCAAGASHARQPDEGTNTNHFVVSDKSGDVVSYTNTIEELGGSGIVVPGRGFLLNNELTDYDFTPLQPGVPDPNLPAPGKRPRSSMSPTIVLKDGRPFLAVGSPGGASIITTVLQILVNRVDLGMTLPEAIAAPRASQRNSATTQAEPDFLTEPTTPGLEKLGQSFAISDTSPLDPTIKIPPTIGAASGLEFLGHGAVLAAGEPVRRGGSAAGVVRPVK